MQKSFSSVLWPLLMFLGGCSFVSGRSHLAVDHSTFVYENASVSNKSEELDYCLLSFKDAQPSETFPLVVILHGSGDNGCDYLELWKKEAKLGRFMILAPNRRRPFEDTKADRTLMNTLVERVLGSYPVDPKRLYMVGTSSGALVAQWLLADGSVHWRKGVLISSAPNEKWMKEADVSKLPPILYVHGAKDEQAKLTAVKAEAETLMKRGGSARLFVDPEGGHVQDESWNEAIISWLDMGTQNEGLSVSK